MSIDLKTQNLISEFGKVNETDVSELEAGVELLDSNNWDQKITALKIKLFIDHGDLMDISELEFVEGLLDKEVQAQPTVKLNGDQQIKRVIELYEGGYPEIDVNQLKSIAVNILGEP